MTDRGTLVRVPGPSEQHEPEVDAEAAAISRTGAGVRLRLFLLQNWLFVAFMVLGTALRVITWLAYQPSILYIDSFRYLNMLIRPAVDGLDPIGYTVIIYPFMMIGKMFGAGLAVTTAVQHLVGLGIAVAMYRICRGLGAARWLSALITTPMLLDGYQLQIEKSIMAEVWSDAILLGAVWLLVAWRFRKDEGRRKLGPLWWQAGLAGMLIAANVPVRIIGIVAVIPFLAYLVLSAARWRDRLWWRRMLVRLTAGLAGFALVLGGYMAAYRAVTGHFGLSSVGGSVLYGRAAEIADCDKLPLDRYLQKVCPNEPIGQRRGVDAYAHHSEPVKDLPPGKTVGDLRQEFGKLVLKHQPLDLIWAVAQDFLKGFTWNRVDHHGDTPLSRWQFQIQYQRWFGTDADGWTSYFDGQAPHVVTPLTTFLHRYQVDWHGYTPGTLLGVAGLFGIAGMFKRRRNGPSLRAESMLTVGMALMLLGGAAGFEFSWRYQLPGLVFLPLTGAIGFTSLTCRERGPRKASPHEADETRFHLAPSAGAES